MFMPKEARLVPPNAASLATGADFLLLLVPGLIWGASFLFIAEGMRSIGPNGVTFVRILIGFTTLSLFPGARKPVIAADWVGIAGLGVFWLALPLSLFPFAEQHVSSALTGMLNGANPLFTVIVAASLARRAPAPRLLAGVAVGMTGAILMALPAIGQGHNSAGAVGMILVALVSYGFALNIARPLQQRNGALPVIWRAQMVALVLTAPLGVPAMMAARWRFGPVAALIALGALGTGVAHVVMSVAAGKLGAARASGTTFLIPAVALVLGVIVRGEKVALLSIAGSGVCVSGAWLMRRARNSTEEHGSGGLPDRWQAFPRWPAGPSDPQQPSAISGPRSFAKEES
jgi:drug/metabolite transporter (DMT)-like permease